MTDRPNLLWIKPGQAEIMEYCEPEEASNPYAIYRRANLMAGLPLFVVILVLLNIVFSASGVSIGLAGACRFHGFGRRLSLIAAACGAACPDLLHSGALSAIIPSFVLPLPESSDV